MKSILKAICIIALTSITAIGQVKFDTVYVKVIQEKGAGHGIDVYHKMKLFDGMKSNNFISGFTGSGFSIDKDGHAELQDMTIRGSLNAYELLISQVRAYNGPMLVSSTGKVEGAELNDGINYIISTDESLSHGFMVDDIIMARRYDPAGGYFYESFMKVTAVTNQIQFYADLLSGDPPQTGFEYVRIGSTSDNARKGIIYLTSADNNSPYIDIKDGIDAYTKLNDATTLKTRLGNLSGITDDFFGTLTGYGLYATNAYIKGKAEIEGEVYATTGGFGGTKLSPSVTITNPGLYIYGGIGQAINSTGTYLGSWTMPADGPDDGNVTMINENGIYGYQTYADSAPALLFKADNAGGKIGPVIFESTKFYMGTGTYATSNTPFYLDADNKFSISDKLYFDGDTTLTFNGTFNSGTINAGVAITSPNISGGAISGTTISGGSLNIGGVSITDERGTVIVMTDRETGDVTTLSSLGLDLGQVEGTPYLAHFGTGVGPTGETGISLGRSSDSIDTKLYRSGANELTTPGALIAASLRSTDGQVRLGGTGGTETELSAANGLISGAPDGLGGVGATYYQVGRGVGPSNEYGIAFGSTGIDTKLYRSGANELKTPGKLIANEYDGSWIGNPIADSYISSAATWNAASGHINQDVKTTSSPTFAGLNLGTGSLTAGSVTISGATTFAADVNGSGSYFMFTANGVNKGLVGLGGSVLGGSANNFDFLSYSGMIRFASNGTIALTLDGSQNAILAKGITLGTSSSTSPGTVRWSGTHLEVYNGSGWVQCDN